MDVGPAGHVEGRTAERESVALVRVWLHITALWALAIAGPIYDVLRRNAEFFVAYRTDRRDILLFVGVMSFAAPLVLWAVVSLVSRGSKRLAQWMLTCLVGLFVALFAAQALQALSPPMALHIGMSTGFGLLGAALYGFPAVRSFTTWLSPAVVLFPIVFLLDRAIWPIVSPSRARAILAAAPPVPTPIVFVVFDQLPLTSLLAPDGTIDRATYPGFGELARTATWFRNATTVGELTSRALPALLSGKYARARQLPTADDYPYNLFTTLGASYRMAVFEPITSLCPDSICLPSGAAGDAPTLAPMLADASVVFAHRVIPRRLAGALPPVDENWRGFADAQGFQRQWANERDSDRRRIFDDFLETIDSSAPDATLYFLHALLPHEPYEYLPSGQRFGLKRGLSGIALGRWTTHEWPVSQGYARHLLQVGFVDGFVQRLITRLRVQNLFDKALIVVTSDHGVGFTPGAGFKSLTRANAEDIMRIPLFVKRPMQRTGDVNHRNVQGIDVLPLVAGILGVPLDFEMDGRSPLDESVPEPSTKIVVQAGGRGQFVIRADELPVASKVVARRVRWFGDGPGPYWTPLIAPARELQGRSLDDLRVEPDASLRISVDAANELTRVNPEGEWIPTLLSGRVRGSIGRSERLVLAVAINGRIEATTETYHDVGTDPDGTWSAIVNPAVYRSGFNDVRIYIVRGTGASAQLVEGFRTGP